MATLPRSTDYTDLDFDALKARLENQIRVAFPTWTNFEVASFGNVLLSAFSFVGDVLFFYQDKQAEESRITSATQRKNLLALAKLIGYKPPGAKAATADVLLVVEGVGSADEDVIISKEDVTIMTPDGSVEFRLLDNVIIPKGPYPIVALGVAENSKKYIDSFSPTGIPNQEFFLTRIPYLDGSAAVTVGSEVYTEVENFLGSTSQSKHFTVVVDQYDRAKILFGNGVNGKIPEDLIQVTYKVGGGTKGNVAANTLTRINGQGRTAITNRFVPLRSMNPNAASGGAERTTVDQIRVLAPESLRVLERTVTREDFEIGATQVAGVARALMLTSNEDPAIPENSGLLFIVPKGGDTPSLQLLDDVMYQVTIEKPCTLTFQVGVQAAPYRDVNIRAIVHFAAGADKNRTRDAINSSLANHFALYTQNEDGATIPNPNIGFGFNYKDSNGAPAGELPYSDIYNVIRDVVGVRKLGDGTTGLLLNGMQQDVVLGLREFPRLGSVEIIDGATGTPV